MPRKKPRNGAFFINEKTIFIEETVDRLRLLRKALKRCVRSLE